MNRIFKIQIIQPGFDKLYKEYEQMFLNNQKDESGPVAIKARKLEGARIEDNITEGGGLLEADGIKNSSIRGNRTFLPSSKKNRFSIGKLEIIGRDKIEQHGEKSKASIENKQEKEGFWSKFFWKFIVVIVVGLLIAYLVFKFGWNK